MKSLVCLAPLAALTIVIPAVAQAQISQKEGTVIMEFIGENDRLIFPVIIGTSTEGAERFRQQIFGGSYFEFAHIDIVPPSIMGSILELPRIKRMLEGDNKTEGKAPIAGLRVAIRTKSNEIVTLISDVEGRSLLSEIQRRLDNYRDVRDQLSEINDRLIDAEKSQSRH